MTTKPTCHAYYRCSTATNAKGDTWNRQKTTVKTWAKRTGYKIISEVQEVFTGSEEDRPQLTELLASLGQDSVLVVSDPSRLSRELSCQMALLAKLRQLGIACVDASSGRSLTDSDDPMMGALTHMQGVFAQLEKRTLVAKLKSGRDAKSKELGKRCEGRKEKYENSELMGRIKQLRKKPRNKKRMSWDNVGKLLFADGYVNHSGNPIQRRLLRQKFQHFKNLKSVHLRRM